LPSSTLDELQKQQYLIPANTTEEGQWLLPSHDHHSNSVTVIASAES